jgi:hypothetical protein
MVGVVIYGGSFLHLQSDLQELANAAALAGVAGGRYERVIRLRARQMQPQASVMFGVSMQTKA